MNLFPAMSAGFVIATLACFVLPSINLAEILFLGLNTTTLVMAASFVAERFFPRAFENPNPILAKVCSLIALVAFALAIIEAENFGRRYTFALAATNVVLCTALFTIRSPDLFRTIFCLIWFLLFASMAVADALDQNAIALVYDSAVSVSLIWIGGKYSQRILAQRH